MAIPRGRPCENPKNILQPRGSKFRLIEVKFKLDTGERFFHAEKIEGVLENFASTYFVSCYIFPMNMAITLKRHLLLLLATIAIGNMFAQTTSLPPEVVSFINKRIESGMNPSIVVGIIDKNGPQYFSFGKRKKGGKKANEHSIYELGSISKVFTAILLADKVIREEMETDDPIANYLPPNVKAPAYDGQQITLGHLSDHTSSLPREPDNFPMTDPENPFSDYTVDLMYDFISKHKLRRPIGSEYEYSNLGGRPPRKHTC